MLNSLFLIAVLHQRISEASHGEALRSTMDLDQSRACDGQFDEEYQPVKAVGKGAFGFVWKAIRRCDGVEVRNIFINLETCLIHVHTTCSRLIRLLRLCDLFNCLFFLNLQVIVKFINKSRIVSDCWVDDPMLGRVSQEIAILTRVQHHNIVKVTVLSIPYFSSYL